MTDNDRELIELAAKAIGYTLKGWNNDHDNKTLGIGDWNPLEDDGDAFRLMTHLEIGIEYKNGWVEAISCGIRYGQRDDDMAQETRNAIVRAAAEIGRGMK